MLDQHFVLLGAAVNFLLSFTYIVKALRGKIQPNKVSWFLWAVIPMIGVAAELRQGVAWLTLTTFMSGFTPLMIFASSFFNKKAYWKTTPLDLFCATLAVAGVVLWQVTSVGNFAIAFAIAADFSAGLPVLIKSFRFPETESSTTFLGGAINALMGLLTVSVWNFQNVAFPVYLLTVCCVFILLIRFKLGKLIVRSL